MKYLHKYKGKRAEVQDAEVMRVPPIIVGGTWRVRELLSFRISPPAWVTPKRRGRPPTGPLSDKGARSTWPMYLRPVLRERKGEVLLSTS
jgi:hypothetical protein